MAVSGEKKRRCNRNEPPQQRSLIPVNKNLQETVSLCGDRPSDELVFEPSLLYHL